MVIFFFFYCAALIWLGIFSVLSSHCTYGSLYSVLSIGMYPLEADKDFELHLVQPLIGPQYWSMRLQDGPEEGKNWTLKVLFCSCKGRLRTCSMLVLTPLSCRECIYCTHHYNHKTWLLSVADWKQLSFAKKRETYAMNVSARSNENKGMTLWLSRGFIKSA